MAADSAHQVAVLVLQDIEDRGEGEQKRVGPLLGFGGLPACGQLEVHLDLLLTHRKGEGHALRRLRPAPPALKKEEAQAAEKQKGANQNEEPGPFLLGGLCVVRFHVSL